MNLEYITVDGEILKSFTRRRKLQTIRKGIGNVLLGAINGLDRIQKEIELQESNPALYAEYKAERRAAKVAQLKTQLF